VEKKMIKNVIFIISVFGLSGCVTTDPTLASGVYRNGGGIYSVSGMGFRDPTTQAVRQCQMDGKNISILASTTERGLYSGNNYPKIVFRCE
jgi:hypothetical protein